jgi:hypothetical protein
MKKVLIALILLSESVATAAPSKHWDLHDYKTFKKGKSKGAIIPSTGGLKAGLSFTKAKTKDKLPGLFYTQLKWRNRYFLGSGDPAQIWVWQNDKIKILHTFKEDIIITDMIRGSGNTIIAAAIPSGRIYSITTDGKSKLIAKLPVKHIWSLYRKGSTLYAGTGPKGQLFQININTGKFKSIWKSKENNILVVTAGLQNSLLLGTDSKARVYNYSLSSKKTSLIYDFSGNEIRDIAVKNQNIYVIVNKLKYKANTSYSSQKTNKSDNRKTKKAVMKATPRKHFSRRKVVQGSGWLYLINDKGFAEKMLESSKGYLTSLKVIGNEAYVADGKSGRIIKIENKFFEAAIMFESEERQILDFELDKNGNGLLVTGDSAGCYSVSRKPGKKPVQYESQVFDTGHRASFGKIIYGVENGKVKIFTRSGPTAEPDDKYWNKWKKLRGVNSLPSGQLTGQTSNKAARYFQYKVTWPTGGKAYLKFLKIFFDTENLRPRILTVKIEDQKAKISGNEEKTDSLIPNKLKHTPHKLKFSWTILNRDKDKLIYKLHVQKVGDRSWRTLPTKKPITKNHHYWIIDFIPEGIYKLKVIASDGISNPPGKELSSHKISRQFTVDNSAPQLSSLRISKNGQVSFGVRDTFSRITAVSFRVDQKDWQMLLPNDQIFDSLREKLNFKLEKQKKGSHILQIRIKDAAGNIGSFSQEFTE